MQIFEKSHNQRKVIALAREEHFNYNFFYFLSTFRPLSNSEQFNRITLIFRGEFSQDANFSWKAEVHFRSP